MGILDKLRRNKNNGSGTTTTTTTSTTTTTPPKDVSNAIDKLSGININSKLSGTDTNTGQSVGGGANLGKDNSIYVNLDDITSNNPNPNIYSRNSSGGFSKTSLSSNSQTTQVNLPSNLQNNRQDNLRNLSQRDLRKQYQLQGYSRRDARNLARQDYWENRNKRGTDYSKIPTIEDLDRNRKFDDNILTANLDRLKNKGVETSNTISSIQELSKDVNEKATNIENLNNIIEEKFGNYINPNSKGELEFTGDKKTYEEYKEYEKELNKEYDTYVELTDKLDIKEQKLYSLGGKITGEGYIEPPTIGVGFKVGGGSARRVPITEFNFDSNSPITNVGKGIDIIGKSIFATSGAGYRDIINTVGRNRPRDEYGNVILRQASNKTINQSVLNPRTTYGTQQVNLLTGKAIDRYETKEFTIFSPKITSEDVENKVYNVGSKGVEYGKYAIPYAGTSLFFGEVAESIISSGNGIGKFIKENPVQSAVIGASLFVPSAVAGTRVIKNKLLQKTLNKELDKLYGQPLKSLTIIDEGAGRVSLVGYRNLNGLNQEVRFVGRISETEKGVKFVPEGEGGSVVSGVIKPRLMGERAFVGASEFEIGSKGSNIFIKDIGDIKLFEEIGTTTVIPKKSFFGIEKVKDLKENKVFNLVEQKVPNEVIKDISLPLQNDRNMFFKFNDVLGLKVSKREVGNVIRIPKQEEEGFKIIQGSGTKSSPEFFQELYKVEQSPILLPKIDNLRNVNMQIVESKSSNIAGEIGAGRGVFLKEEIKSEEISPVLKENIRNNYSLVEKQKDNLFTSGGKSKLFGKEKSNNKEVIDFGFKDLSKLNEEVKSEQKSRQRQQQSQQQKSMQRLAQVIQQRAKQVNRVEEVKPTNFNFKFKLPNINGKNDLVDKNILGDFEVFVTKKGKDVKLKDTFKTLGEAKSKLLGELGTTLRAGGYISKGGTPINFEELGIFGTEFRRSKVSPFKVIQVKNKRLKRGGRDVQEIKFFR